VDFNQKASAQVLLFSQDGKLISSKDIELETGIIEVDVKVAVCRRVYSQVVANGEVVSMRFIKL